MSLDHDNHPCQDNFFLLEGFSNGKRVQRKKTKCKKKEQNTLTRTMGNTNATQVRGRDLDARKRNARDDDDDEEEEEEDDGRVERKAVQPQAPPACRNLGLLSNACELGVCVRSLVGLASDSASPTDILIPELLPGTHYLGSPVNGRAFLKMWVTPRDVARALPPPTNDAPTRSGQKKSKSNLREIMLHSVRQLDYELRISRDVVRPLIDYGVTNNIIKTLGSGSECTTRQVLGMLCAGVFGCDDPINRAAMRFAFANSLRFMLGLNRTAGGSSTSRDTRPSTTAEAKRIRQALIAEDEETNEAQGDVKESTRQARKFERTFPGSGVGAGGGAGDEEKEHGDGGGDDEPIRSRLAFDDFHFNMLVNDAVPVNAVTFMKWLIKHKKQIGTRQYWRLVFQVVAGCRVMQLSRMWHRDMHLNNIWVLPQSPQLTVAYAYDDRVFTLDTHLLVVIFDFDRAYVERLGCNERLCTFDGRYDTYKFIASLWLYAENADPRVREQLVDLVVPDALAATQRERRRAEFTALFEKKSYRERTQEMERVRPHDRGADLPEIMAKVARLAGLPLTQGLLPDRPVSQVLVCNESVFQPDTRVLLPNRVQAIREQLLAPVQAVPQ